MNTTLKIACTALVAAMFVTAAFAERTKEGRPPRRAGVRAVKGGAWRTPRTDCRTECREIGHSEVSGHPDVVFRVIHE